MRSENKCILGLVIIISITMSCNYNLNPKESRIFVVEEKQINDSKIFFWFRGAGQITQEGISYFQITDDRCKLSVKAADAYCKDAVQVYDIKNDTVFVLAMSPIVFFKNENVKIEKVPYSIELYDVNKRPNRADQYFLDSLCKE